MKAPFPWFGGKRRVAPDVWAAHINRHLERLWLSPGCLTANTQPSLFDEVASIKEVL